MAGLKIRMKEDKVKFNNAIVCDLYYKLYLYK